MGNVGETCIPHFCVKCEMFGNMVFFTGIALTVYAKCVTILLLKMGRSANRQSFPIWYGEKYR